MNRLHQQLSTYLGMRAAHARRTAGVIFATAAATCLCVGFEPASAQGLPASAVPAATSTGGRVSDAQPQSPSTLPSSASPTQSQTSVPANKQQPLQWHLGQLPAQQQNPPARAVSTQAAQTPTSQSALPGASTPAGNSRFSTQQGTSLAGRAATPARRSGPGLAAGRATRGPRPAPSVKQVKLVPQRMQIIDGERRMLEAQNSLARATRIYTSGVVPLAPSRTLLDGRAGAQPKPMPASLRRAILSHLVTLSPSAPGLTRASASSAQFASAPPGLARAAAPAGGLEGTSPAPSVPLFKAKAGLLKRPSGIWFVNNKENGFLVTPNGYVTIQGKGFGATPGQVKLLVTSVYGDAYSPGFQVIDWHDDEIFASLPRVIDIFDQTATVEVVTHSGASYRLGGGIFHAARDEYYWDDGLDQVIQIRSNANWAITRWGADGGVIRYDTGGSIDCKAPGTDYLYVTLAKGDQQAGFVLSGISATFGRTDSGDGDIAGDPGDRVFTPGYSLGEWTRGSPVGTFQVAQAIARGESTQTDMMPVSWGVWRTHSAKKPPFEVLSDLTDSGLSLLGNIVFSGDFSSSPTVNRQIGPDQCVSDYKVTLWVIGPAFEVWGYEVGTPQ
jgi:hypothetical protein